jgi:hypothetical protein
VRKRRAVARPMPLAAPVMTARDGSPEGMTPACQAVRRW